MGTYHCLFEQSGTFKNEFKKLGYAAFDYDILNDFNETDFQIDLFKEIENAYKGGNQYLMVSRRKIQFFHSSHAQDLKCKLLWVLGVNYRK